MGTRKPERPLPKVINGADEITPDNGIFFAQHSAARVAATILAAVAYAYDASIWIPRKAMWRVVWKVVLHVPIGNSRVVAADKLLQRRAIDQ